MSWAYVADVGGHGAGRKQRHRSGFATAAEAAAERARVLHELSTGVYIPASKVLLGDYLDSWLESGPTKGWKPNTQRIYRSNVMRIKRRLAHVRLQALTRDQIRIFYAWLLREGKLPYRGAAEDGTPGPLAPQTVASIQTCLHAALEDAVRDKLIPSNPANSAYRFSIEKAGRELQAWTLDEMRAFLAFVAGQRNAGLYAVALATGMRRGELLGLRWRDVDLEGRWVSIRRQWTPEEGGKPAMVPLKTGTKAFRTIEIDPLTVAILERQQQLVEAERAAWGSAYDQRWDLVFPRENGAPQDPGWTSESFMKLADDCPDVPRIVFHGMRHTHATLLLEDGVSIKAVAERLGDREDTVLGIYGHITPRGRFAAANRVESWFAGVPREKREQSVSETRRPGPQRARGDDELN